jgi:hypothetical protein
MANAIYPKAKAALMKGGLNLLTDTIKAQLIDTGAYTYAAAHEFLSSVPAGARIGNAATLSGKTVTNSGSAAVFDADDSLFTSVPAGTGTGTQSEAILIYRDTGDAATSNLIELIDTATGLPVTTNGGNVTMEWNANGIIRLD